MIDVLEIDRKKPEVGMLRMVLAVLVWGALAFGGYISASAQEPTPASSTRAVAPAARGPLSPGGAAGIKQAQALLSNLRNFIPLAVVSGLALVVVVTGNDDDDSATTTGTN